MSRPSLEGRLGACLAALNQRRRDVGGLVLVDGSGEVVASTLTSRSLEEGSASLTARLTAWLARARRDLELDELQYCHLAGSGRQLFLVPAGDDSFLLAMAAPGAPASRLGPLLAAAAAQLGAY